MDFTLKINDLNYYQNIKTFKSNYFKHKESHLNTIDFIL